MVDEILHSYMGIFPETHEISIRVKQPAVNGK